MRKEKYMYVAISEIDEKGEAGKLNLVSKKPEEVSYFDVDRTEKISDDLFPLRSPIPSDSLLNELGYLQ